MKVAITTLQPSLDGEIDPRFGRCGYYLFVDTETMEFEAKQNPAQQAFGGAGVQAAQFVADQGAEAVISGNFGPNAFQTLLAAGLKVYGGVFGDIRDAIDKLKKGELIEVKGSNVPPHYGAGGYGGGGYGGGGFGGGGYGGGGFGGRRGGGGFGMGQGPGYAPQQGPPFQNGPQEPEDES